MCTHMTEQRSYQYRQPIRLYHWLKAVSTGQETTPPPPNTHIHTCAHTDFYSDMLMTHLAKHSIALYMGNATPGRSRYDFPPFKWVWWLGWHKAADWHDWAGLCFQRGEGKGREASEWRVRNTDWLGAYKPKASAQKKFLKYSKVNFLSAPPQCRHMVTCHTLEALIPLSCEQYAESKPG